MLIERAFHGKQKPKKRISQPGHRTVLCHVTEPANYLFPFVSVQLVFGLTDASSIVLTAYGHGTYQRPSVNSQAKNASVAIQALALFVVCERMCPQFVTSLATEVTWQTCLSGLGLRPSAYSR